MFGVVSLVLLDTIGRSRNCLTVAKQIKGPLSLNLAKNLRKETAGFNFLTKSMIAEILARIPLRLRDLFIHKVIIPGQKEFAALEA